MTRPSPTAVTFATASIALLAAPQLLLAQCDLFATISRVECDDTGTPTDPSDDTYSAFVFAVGAQASAVEILRDGEVVATANAGIDTRVDLGLIREAAGSSRSLVVRSAAAPSCEVGLSLDRVGRSVQAPAAALSLERIGEEVDDVYVVRDADGGILTRFFAGDLLGGDGGEGIVQGGLSAVPVPGGGLALLGSLRLAADPDRLRGVVGRVSADAREVSLVEVFPDRSDDDDLRVLDVDGAGNVYVELRGSRSVFAFGVSPSNEVTLTTRTLGDEEFRNLRVAQLSPDEASFYFAYGTFSFGRYPQVLRYDVATGNLATTVDFGEALGFEPPLGPVSLDDALVTGDGAVVAAYTLDDQTSLARFAADGTLEYSYAASPSTGVDLVVELAGGGAVAGFGDGAAVLNPDGTRGCGGGAGASSCALSVALARAYTCDDAGTPADPADDTYAIAIEVTNGSAEGAYSGSLAGIAFSGTYGIPTEIVVGEIASPVNLGTREIVVVDGTDPACRLEGFIDRGERVDYAAPLAQAVEVYRRITDTTSGILVRSVGPDGGGGERVIDLIPLLRERAGADVTDVAVGITDVNESRPDGAGRFFGSYRDVAGALRLFSGEVSPAGELARLTTYPRVDLGLEAVGSLRFQRLAVRRGVDDADYLQLIERVGGDPAAPVRVSYVRLDADGALAWVTPGIETGTVDPLRLTAEDDDALTLVAETEDDDVLVATLDRATGALERTTFRTLLGDPDGRYSSLPFVGPLPDGGLFLRYRQVNEDPNAYASATWIGPDGEVLFDDQPEGEDDFTGVGSFGPFVDGGLLLRGFDYLTGDPEGPGFKLNPDGTRGCGTEAPPARLPDLTLADLAVANSPLDSGEVLDYTFTIANRGDGDAPGNFSVLAYLSDDRTVSDDDVQDGVVGTGNFAAGSSIADVAGASRVDLAPGDYFLILVADARGAVAESDEGNNAAVVPFTVDRVVAPPPVVRRDTIDLSLGAILSAGVATEVDAAVGITVTLANAGPDAAGAVAVAVPLPEGVEFRGAAVSRGEFAGGTWSVGAVAPGTSVTLDLTYVTTASGGFVQFAEVSAAEGDDLDSAPANSVNQVANEDDEVVLDLRGATTGVRDAAGVAQLGAYWTGEAVALEIAGPGTTGRVEVLVTDLGGRVVARDIVTLTGAAQRLTLDAAPVARGMYVVAIAELRTAERFAVW